jgi:hypothetical protein
MPRKVEAADVPLADRRLRDRRAPASPARTEREVCAPTPTTIVMGKETRQLQFDKLQKKLAVSGMDP